MNHEASQTPEPIDEWLEQIQQENPKTENFSVDSDTPALPIDSEAGDTIDELTADVPLATDTTALGLKVQSESQKNSAHAQGEEKLTQLQQTEAELKAQIVTLQATYNTLQTQLSDTQTALGQIVQDSLAQLEQRKQVLQVSVEQLERRQERIRNEMRTTFAGTSQDLAIRVQGFKDYLTGSLQDLATAAEQLKLLPEVREREKPTVKETQPGEPEAITPQFSQQQFQDTTKQIRRLIDQYRNKPDYYGGAWQLRRTFEPVHAERVSNWFFGQGGRGALRTMGSRLQNTLIAAAIISILHKLYGDRVRTLVLANTPERLGEWRRGLQDCLGISRPDFGPDRGVVLFEAPDALAQKAERLVKANQLPIIIIDDSEEQISLGLLQFPLWLAFAPDPKAMKNYDDDF